MTKSSTPPRPVVTPTLSVSLDVIRVSLALIVVAAHLTLPVFQRGWPNLVRVAVAGVGGFFVLSGFTICLLTDKSRALDPRRYFAERLSRLWSVAIPALALTIVCDAISNHVSPGFYAANIADDADHPVRRILVNFLFLSQVWGADYAPLSNNPFWSLGYELGFYVIYGVWLACPKRWRWLGCAAAVAVFGPNVAVMLVLWLMGAGIHAAYARMTPRRAMQAAKGGVMGLVALAGAGVVLRHAMGRVVEGVQHGLRAYFAAFGVSAGRVESKTIFSGLAFGAVFFCIVCAAKANDAYGFVHAERWVKRARRVGEFTFPLYLFHFPLFVLAAAIGAYDRTSSAQKLVELVVVCGIILLLTPLTEVAKVRVRAVLNQALGIKREPPPPAREGVVVAEPVVGPESVGT